MKATATIRELRNEFPKVRQLVDAEGEVLVTERGTPRYRLIAYRTTSTAVPPPKDHLARMMRYQPRPLSAAASRALHHANRGSR